MEIQRPKTSLQQKLALLKALQEGNIEQSQKLLQSLSKTAKTNPDLYNKFHNFVSEHRQGIDRMQRQQKQDQQQIIIVDGDNQDDWETDEEVSYGSQDQEKQQRQKSPKRLVKNMGHSKSSILIKTIKEVKKPYFIHSLQPQKPIYSSTANLKDPEFTGSKTIDNHSLVTNISKATNLSRKAKSKPYFPPIHGAKTTLKLSKK